MLDMEKILALFSLFSDLEGEAAAPWRGFCEAAAAAVQARIKPDVEPAEVMDALCSTAAGLAYADYLAVQSMGRRGGELRVGDIAVKDSASGARGDADEIREHFLGRAAHLLLPECPALLAAGGNL